MSKDFSLERLADYIANNIQKIGAVRKEVEEIQIGFNSAYVEWKAKHDATLERLTEALTDRLEEVGPALQTPIEERAVEERRLIAERRQELRDRLIPATQTEADQTLQEGRQLTDELRSLNPELDSREEELKAQRAALQEELAQLNDQIRRLSRWLGVVIHFPKIIKLDRQRHQTIGKLYAIRHELKKVRQEWETTSRQTQDIQDTLQTRWQESTLKLAQLQGELAYLDDEISREALTRKRALRYVIDNLKEPAACPAADLKQELDDMVELNVQTDDYQMALGKVSSLMSLLDGINEGLRRFNESVRGVINEHKMHSSYLPRLNVSIPDEVLAFHKQWDGLLEKVRDDSRICAHPAEFVVSIQSVMEKDLDEAKIQAMFEGLGRTLDWATREWRG